MYTKQALRDIGIRDQLNAKQKESLDSDGYFIVENVLTNEQCDLMAAEFDRLAKLEQDQGGHEVHIEPTAQRISNIFNKSRVFDPCLEISALLQASHHLLGEFKLHGANLREPLPGGGHQDLHADVPKNFSDDWWVSNAVVAFDDITLENGPMRAIPGSHHWQPINVATVNVYDWQPTALTEEEISRVPPNLADPYPNEVLVTCKRGSAVIINSCLWHSGTLNKGGGRRRVLHLTYTRRDLPQQLVQRQYMTPALYERMSPAHRFLMDIEPMPDGAVAMTESAGRGSGDWWAVESSESTNESIPPTSGQEYT